MNVHPSIDEEAGRWFSRREVGLSPAEESEFQAWLSSNASHAQAYADWAGTWTLVDRAREIASLQDPVARPWFVRPVVRGFLAAAAVLLFGLFLFTSRDNSRYDLVVATDPAGFKKVESPDGSVIRLNGGTEVEINFSTSERRVTLGKGEAFFIVAADVARPFTVTAGANTVRAVGTAFNVALTPSGLSVIVTEGRVQVESLARARPAAEVSPSVARSELDAGQKLTLSGGESAGGPAPSVVPMDAPQVEQALKWQVRLLEFEDAPLAVVVARFNRHNQHQLVIEDPELGRKTFGGTFRADNYSDLVELLGARYDVIAQRGEGRTTLRLRR